jgi:hypothetical protein
VAESGGTLLSQDHRQANPRGGFRSVYHLIETIMDYVERHDDKPKTFVWTTKAEDILAKIAGACDALNVASE